jgi:P27 family predicted phage terminase small subunit
VWLSDEAKVIWDRTVAELATMGLAYSADVDSLVVYVNAVKDYAAAQRIIDRVGVMIKGQSRESERPTLVKNPACTVVNYYASVITRYAREFGLTPAARVAFANAPAGEQQPHELERLLS